MSNELDLRIRQAMQRVVDESPLPPDIPDFPHTITTTRPRIPGWVAAVASAAVVLILVGGTSLLIDADDGAVGEAAAPPTTVASTPSTSPAAPAQATDAGQTASVTVSGVAGHPGDHLAGVLYEGNELTDLDRDALGGFWTIIPNDEAATTNVIRQPADADIGIFPFVSDEALILNPGVYTLVIWIDDALNPVTRWVPLNSDGMGLYGCQTTFEVTNDAQTDIAIAPHLQPDGWNASCTTGAAIPGTDAAAAVAPDDTWMSELEMSMPSVVGVGDGQTVSITVSGVKNHVGQHLAGVLYDGGTLTDIGRQALGGFWTTVPDDATTSEVVREPGDNSVGRFPFVSDQALILDPGTYTLVIWVDFDLNPVSRWVPINTDGRGLFGCRTTFEVTDDAQTAIAVAPELQPDGWHISCAGHSE